MHFTKDRSTQQQDFNVKTFILLYKCMFYYVHIKTKNKVHPQGKMIMAGLPTLMYLHEMLLDCHAHAKNGKYALLHYKPKNKSKSKALG